VLDVDRPNPHAARLRLDVEGWSDHVSGQYVVVRLTAPDGYRAQRSYSIASAAGDPVVELFVERLDDGEVSPHLVDVAEAGDVFQVRGPIGGAFTWDGTVPALLVGGGSGVVPLVSMLRTARVLGRTDLLRIAVSARTLADLPYADELVAAGALVAISREPYGDRPAARLTSAELAGLLRPGQVGYVCGSTAFAEAAGRILTDLGMAPSAVQVEQFGPSGG
jgi:ferredoxin-NADP reductase